MNLSHFLIILITLPFFADNCFAPEQRRAFGSSISNTLNSSSSNTAKDAISPKKSHDGKENQENKENLNLNAKRTLSNKNKTATDEILPLPLKEVKDDSQKSTHSIQEQVDNKKNRRVTFNKISRIEKIEIEEIKKNTELRSLIQNNSEQNRLSKRLKQMSLDLLELFNAEENDYSFYFNNFCLINEQQSNIDSNGIIFFEQFSNFLNNQLFNNQVIIFNTEDEFVFAQALDDEWPELSRVAKDYCFKRTSKIQPKKERGNSLSLSSKHYEMMMNSEDAPKLLYSKKLHFEKNNLESIKTFIYRLSLLLRFFSWLLIEKDSEEINNFFLALPQFDGIIDLLEKNIEDCSNSFEFCKSVSDIFIWALIIDKKNLFQKSKLLANPYSGFESQGASLNFIEYADILIKDLYNFFEETDSSEEFLARFKEIIELASFRKDYLLEMKFLFDGIYPD